MPPIPAAFEVRYHGAPVATVRLTTSGVEVEADGVRNDAVRMLLVRATRKTERVGYHPPGTNIDGTQAVPVDPASEYDTVQGMIDEIPGYEVIDLNEADSS